MTFITSAVDVLKILVIALGLRWNSDETVDLIAISSADAITVLIHEVATGVERTTGPHKFGVRVELVTSGKYLVRAAVNGVVKKVLTASTNIPGEAMYPTVAYTDDNTAAPAFQEDFVAFANRV